VKLAILRVLEPGRRLGVVWYLFPDEHHNKDGGHREYLERPSEWKHLDPDLFEALLKIEREHSRGENKRGADALENAGILPGAVFAADPVPCEILPFSLRPERRGIWLDGIKKKLQGCDLVFLDPDNGIAPEGLRLTQRRAGKSVAIEEMAALQKSNRTMVVYHHQTRRRGGHRSEIGDLATRLTKSRLRVSGALRAKPWSPRVFFILNGDEEILRRAESIADVWEDRMEWTVWNGTRFLKS
jgi:hypothetical protein